MDSSDEGGPPSNPFAAPPPATVNPFASSDPFATPAPATANPFSASAPEVVPIPVPAPPPIANAWAQPATPAWAPPPVSPLPAAPVANIGPGARIGLVAGIALLVHGLGFLVSSRLVASALTTGELPSLARAHGLGIMLSMATLVVGLFLVARRSGRLEQILCVIALFLAMGLFFGGLVFYLAADSTDSFGLGTYVLSAMIVGLVLVALLVSLRRPDPLALAACAALAVAVVAMFSTRSAVSNDTLVLTRGVLPFLAYGLSGTAVLLRFRQRTLTAVAPFTGQPAMPVVPLSPQQMYGSLAGPVDLAGYSSARPWAIAVVCVLPIVSLLPLLGTYWAIAGMIPDGIVNALFAYTAAKNCRAFGAARMRFTPGNAALSFVFPIANLVAGPYALQEIWQRSYGSTQTEASKTIRNAYALIWTSIGAGVLVNIIVGAVMISKMDAHGAASFDTTPYELIGAGIPMIIRFAAFLVRATALFQIVARQDDSYRRLRVITP